MLNESLNKSLDIECLSATLIDHQKDHIIDLDLHSAASLESSIFKKINEKTNESKALSSLQRDIFTADSLKDFIREIWSLKIERRLPDDTAVSALSLLLPDVASKWWEATRPFVKTWHLAVALILKVLDNKRTLRDAWRELINSNHQHDRFLDAFLTEQQILLAEIRQSNIKLPGQTEIDLVYYKLNPTIRKKIDRKRITSFDELLRQAELHGLTECDPNLPEPSNLCSYCKRLGHNDITCVDNQYEAEKAEQKERYKASDIPYIAMKVNGIPEYVHLASDSQLNIITDSLYGKLLQRGCIFEPSKQVISTIRSTRKNLLQMTTVIVECNKHIVVAPVVKLQNTRGNKNCFGLNFIESCDLLTYLGSQ